MRDGVKFNNQLEVDDRSQSNNQLRGGSLSSLITWNQDWLDNQLKVVVETCWRNWIINNQPLDAIVANEADAIEADKADDANEANLADTADASDNTN